MSERRLKRNGRFDRTPKWGNVVKKPHELAAEIEYSPFNSGYAVPSSCGTGVKSVFRKLWRRHDTGEPHLLGVSRQAAPERSMTRSQLLMRHRSGRIKLAIGGLCLAIVASRVALADPENGRRLADRCVRPATWSPQISSAQARTCRRSRRSRAPGFNAQRLTFFLLEPHPRMPSMGLSRKEAADIVDYIKQLRDAK
jgi:hypothetical protein